MEGAIGGVEKREDRPLAREWCGWHAGRHGKNKKNKKVPYKEDKANSVTTKSVGAHCMDVSRGGGVGKTWVHYTNGPEKSRVKPKEGQWRMKIACVSKKC